MQPSTLLTIAAFPVLFAAVMAAPAANTCNATDDALGGTVKDCAVDTPAAINTTCKFFGPGCISKFHETKAVDDADTVAVFNKKPDEALKIPNFFVKIKKTAGSFVPGAVNTNEAVATALDGLSVEEFKLVPATVITSIKATNFADLTPATFKLFDSKHAAGITDAQLAVLKKAQAEAFGIEPPTKADDIKSKKADSACSVMTKEKIEKVPKEAKDALQSRCGWANSASALQVTAFVTLASLASVFVMNALAF